MNILQTENAMWIGDGQNPSVRIEMKSDDVTVYVIHISCSLVPWQTQDLFSKSSMYSGTFNGIKMKLF